MNIYLVMTKSYKNILLALPWYHHKLHQGASQFAAKNRWHLDASWSRFGFSPSHWNGDGIITQTPYLKEYRDFLETQNIPIVTLSPETYRNSPCVYDPSDYIAKVAYDYFRSKGFINFASYSIGIGSHSREDEFAKILKKKKHSFTRINITKTLSLAERCAFIKEQLAELPKPVAVFTGNDELGAEFILATVQAGYHIPQEVAILGVHNDDLTCQSSIVGLSSIDCGLDKIAFEGAKILEKLMNGEDVPKVTLIKSAKVITRASTEVIATDNPKLHTALSFIQNNFQKGISIKDIAEEAGLSVSGLQYLFKEKLDFSPMKEVNRLKLKHAKSLLSSKAWSVDVIAKESGFKTSRNFYHVFQQEEGLSPDAYRKKLQDI